MTTDAAYRAAYGKGQAVPVTLHGIDWTKTGAEQNTEAAAKGISLNRIEDGAFDPRNPNDYYFLTTEGGNTTRSRTTRSPARRSPGTAVGCGGCGSTTSRTRPRARRWSCCSTATEAPYLNKPDNMDIDHAGPPPDPGGPGRQRAPGAGAGLRPGLGRHRRPGAVRPGPLRLRRHGCPGHDRRGVERDHRRRGPDGRGTFLFDAQVHTAAGLSDPARQVEHGQLLSMTVDWDAVF